MGIEAAINAEGFMTTQLKRVINWSRRNSLWPMPFATACCGIELMATASSRYDLARFGAEVMRFSPRQSDLLIVAGRISIKTMPVLQRIYAQMAEPKWVISMGACASTGGVFDTYAVVQGCDQFLPVDVYVPGCPPRPEQLIEGVMAIQRIIDEEGIPPQGPVSVCLSASPCPSVPPRARRPCRSGPRNRTRHRPVPAVTGDSMLFANSVDNCLQGGGLLPTMRTR